MLCKKNFVIMDYNICVYAMMSELLVKGCSGKERNAGIVGVA